MQTTLNDYVANYFHSHTAVTVVGAMKITAHHNRDNSTAHYYDEMEEGELLVSFWQNGEHYRCKALDGDTLVNVTPDRKIK